MIVCHVLAPQREGGLQRVVEALARGHAATGHEVHVLAVLGPQGEPPAWQLGEARAELLRLPSRAYLHERRAVAARCRALGAQVVHCHGYRADVVHGWAARALGAPALSTVHGFTGGDLKNRLYERLQLAALRRMAAVVAVSRPLEALMRARGVAPHRLRLIPNAWADDTPGAGRAEARAALGLPAQGTVVAFVGRLSAEKGADVLLEAVARRRTPAAVSFLGDGPERDRLRAQARALGLEGVVRWHGVVPRAGALLRAFDALVMPSRTEGTPIVLFEAMAAGVPVVATAVGGVPDVVGEHEALLVAPGDPDALAEGIRHVLAEPAAAARRARAARARLDSTFSAEPWLRAYEALYRELAPRPARAARAERARPALPPG